jgi:hypothetical protein
MAHEEKPKPPSKPQPEPHPGAMILLAIATEWGAVMSDRKKRGVRR